MVLLNWLMAGGIFKRKSIIFFIRCKRTYFGQRTKRVRSRLGWIAPPRRKFLGVFSKSGFFFAAFLFSARGAEATFFPFAALPMAPRRGGGLRGDWSAQDVGATERLE